MTYTCIYSSAPLRAEPKHSAEMTSELLYGEYMTGTGKEEKLWIEVQCEWDDYIGWVSKGQVAEVEDFSKVNIHSLPGDSMQYPGSNSAEAVESRPIKIEDFIETYLGTPYYWGGRTPTGIDCSGLSQLYYRLHAVRIPRDASVQALCGEEFTDWSDIKTGDLAFFAGDSGKINHVAIFTNPEQVIHSTEKQGGVVLDSIDSKGIISSVTGDYSHKLKKMVKVFFDSDHLKVIS